MADMMASITDKASAMAALGKLGSIKDKAQRMAIIRKCAKFAPLAAKRAMAAEFKKK